MVIASAIVGMVAAQSIGVFGGGVPSIASPASVLLVLPAFFGVPTLIIVAGFVVLFWLWNAYLFQGSSRVPSRTVALLVITAVFSTVNFVLAWEFGVKYQGFMYAIVSLTLSILLLLVCAVLLWRARLRPSFSRTPGAYTNVRLACLLCSFLFGRNAIEG